MQKLLQEVNKHQDVNLFGLSRGAVCIANLAGTNKLGNVGCIILESPFDDVKSVVKQKTGFRSCASLLPCFTDHNPNGIQPIKVAQNVNKDIPIFIYCSKQDALIPAQSTINYYKALRKANHKKVYLSVVDHGRHANILNDKDGQIIRNTIHAFLKAHNRPHNIGWAKAGLNRLKNCQP
jgi:hypothetical protein